MTPEEIKKEIEQISEGIDERIKATEDMVKSGEGITEGIKEQITELVEKFEKKQEQLDQLEASLKKFGTPAQNLKTFGDLLKESLEGSDQWKAKKRGVFNLKAPATMLESSHLTGDVVEPDRVPGIYKDPERNVRIRSLIPTTPTKSNSIRFIQEQNYEDGAATTSEGAQFTQSDFDLAEVSVQVEKIATYFKCSNELLEDIPGLAGYIGQRGGAKLKQKEDTQILHGDGSSPNLDGLVTQATAFSTSTSVTEGHLLDVLALAVSQAKIAEYMPTAIICNPADTEGIYVAKDGDKRYLHPWTYTNSPITVMGVPVIESTAITADNFLVGDFRRACQLFDKRQLQVEFTDSNEDDFEKDLVTIRVSERLALAVYNTTSFITGVISTQIGNITLS